MTSVQQKLGRVTGLIVFTGMVALQLWQFPTDPQRWVDPVRWFLVTLLFSLFLAAYVFRKPALSEAKGLKETLLPLFCAGLPFAIIMLPDLADPLLREAGWEDLRKLLWELFWSRLGQGHTSGLVVMALGEVITVGGMLTLRSNFSIFSEARQWVSTGLYRWVRHPLYAGEILSLVGYVLFWPSFWSLTLTLAFTVFQAIRARVEEHKLIETFPDYLAYREQVGFLLPRIGPR